MLLVVFDQCKGFVRRNEGNSMERETLPHIKWRSQWGLVQGPYISKLFILLLGYFPEL